MEDIYERNDEEIDKTTHEIGEEKMINPKIRAKDRIHSNLPPELQELMRQHILPEEEHMRILKEIMKVSYEGKKPVEHPKFIIVCRTDRKWKK